MSKATYASHGVFIQKINEKCLGKWDKPKNAVINPIPSTKPRQKPSYYQQQQKMKLQSNTFKTGFRFQQPINQKPISQQLIQPFLYIQKVIQKGKGKGKKKNVVQNKQTINIKTEEDKQKQKDNKQNRKKKQSLPKFKPFITSTVVNKSKTNIQNKPTMTVPKGYSNLFQYQLDKKNTANLIFQKMLQSEVENVKDLFNLWNKNDKRNLTQDINIKQQEFVSFVKELVSGKVTAATIKHFFQLYRTNSSQNILTPTQIHGLQSQNTGQISIKAFAFNYGKYKKTQTQIINIMSDKAARQRYTDLKKYISDFLSYYPQLKQGMKAMKQYQQTLRKHFRRLYESYQNPFQSQINQLKAELEKPIIKYDKAKKEKIQKKIEEYERENSKIYSKLTTDYNHFMDSYQETIVKNHDLLFTKRTIAYLLWPIIQREPVLTRSIIQQQVGVRQEQKQRYLECLSDIIVEIDSDKKHLAEDCFTLGQLVQLVRMKFRNKKTKVDEQLEAFTIQSLKKLIKQIKRQFLIKYNLIADDLNNFPADQQISLQIIHTCFQMECTKVLFKNKIWSELLEMLPERSIQSKLHQRTIDANTCMQYLKKYFKKLDERSNLQRNKSKQVSLFVENAYNQNFGKYAKIIDKIISGLDGFAQGIEQVPEQNQNLAKKKKKVAFADAVDSKLAVERGQKNLLEPQEDEGLQVAKDIIKMIHLGAQSLQDKDNQSISININKLQTNKSAWRPKQQRIQSSPYQNLQMLKSMARSYFEPQSMNTNAFDIRFYEKLAEEQNLHRVPEQKIIELGNSLLLSGAPHPQQIEGQKQDPLRISRFLLKTIDKDVKEQQQNLHNKQYDKDIRQGVSHNYFKQRIKLQNKPTRYDSQGKSKYSVLLPVGYYESYIVDQSVPDQQKWYLRPHHVETLTQNPLSKKDNIIHTQYQSKLEKLSLKKRPDQYIIQQNVKRKQGLISELSERIQALKHQISYARRQKDIQGYKVNPALLNNYYTKITEGKQDKQLQLAAYEGVLYDLRRKQRELLNKYRSNQTKQRGQPNQKWWQKKDKQFNRQARKQRELLADLSGVHKSYVQKLKNNEIY